VLLKRPNSTTVLRRRGSLAANTDRIDSPCLERASAFESNLVFPLVHELVLVYEAVYLVAHANKKYRLTGSL
jgi:hypothetical protein